jgi:hypothetical protein
MPVIIEGQNSGALRDAFGNIVSDSQQTFIAAVQTINGQRSLITGTNPNYKPPASPGVNVPGLGTSPAPIPPQFQFSFDTIGQVIYRTLGHCRLPLRVIWAQGVNESGDISVATTQTFAAALCEPIDPSEEGDIAAIWDGANLTFSTDAGGIQVPLGWSAVDAAQLAVSLAGLIVYPGDEAQLPEPLIIADKGASRTNAFRGIRYIVFPDYPVTGSGGLPQITIEWRTTSPSGTPHGTGDGAVEFLGGTG